MLVIVVTWNSSAWVDRCLGSVRDSSAPADILVVDNGSTDGTLALVREHFPEAKVVEAGENLGFGRANNIGFKHALEGGYDYVYLLNSDAWLMPDTLGRLLEEAAKGEFALLSPLQMSAQGGLDPRFEAKCGRRCKAGGTVEVPFVMAAHWLFSTDTLRRVGGFSPAFEHYGEDDNWIDRLHFHGLSCAVVCDARAVHDRALRPATKQWRMRLKKVSRVVALSDPAGSWRLRTLLEPFILIGMSVKNLSLEPLRHYPVLRKKYPEIKLFRDISKGEGAFL